MRTVVVVGGGAAGLMAAGRAAQEGSRVLLLEKMPRPGRKLCITGKGRCNLTNIAPVEDFISHFGKNGRFLRQSFSSFFSTNLVRFFETLGVATVTERGGRVFPKAGDAEIVVQKLVKWAVDQGVTIETGAKVTKLLLEDKSITGLLVNDTTYSTDTIIIATGGASYPGTGSSGDGYRLAESAGHKVVPVRPALVPLETAGNTAKRMQGLSLKNVNVRVAADGRKHSEEFGEMLFTHFGLSGPAILTLSGGIVDALRENKKVTVSIDLKPALDEERLDARLIRDWKEHGRRQLSTLMEELLPAKMIPVFIDMTGIPPDKYGHQITAEERRKLRTCLKGFQLEITKHRPIEEAIVTAGGVDTKEIDPRTMESRLVKGLYFAGEVIDINADTGGYNLQAAFSTGWVAGTAAAGTAKK